MTSEYIVIEKRECHNCGHKGLTDEEYVYDFFKSREGEFDD